MWPWGKGGPIRPTGVEMWPKGVLYKGHDMCANSGKFIYFKKYVRRGRRFFVCLGG